MIRNIKNFLIISIRASSGIIIRFPSMFYIAILASCESINKLADPATLTEESTSADRSSLVREAFSRGQDQALADTERGIVALPHFFCEIGEEADFHSFTIQFMWEKYNVDYCSIGNGSGEVSGMLAFIKGYNSISEEYAVREFGGRNLSGIVKESKGSYDFNKTSFQKFRELNEKLFGRREVAEVEGINGMRLSVIARSVKSKKH